MESPTREGIRIFGPTIHTRFNQQPFNSKKEILDYMVGPFWDIFNQYQVTTLTCEYLKMIRDTYMVNIEKMLGMIDLL